MGGSARRAPLRPAARSAGDVGSRSCVAVQPSFRGTGDPEGVVAPSASEIGRARFLLLGLVLRVGFILSQDGVQSRM